MPMKKYINQYVKKRKVRFKGRMWSKSYDNIPNLRHNPEKKMKRVNSDFIQKENMPKLFGTKSLGDCVFEQYQHISSSNESFILYTKDGEEEIKKDRQ